MGCASSKAVGVPSAGLPPAKQAQRRPTLTPEEAAAADARIRAALEELERAKRQPVPEVDEEAAKAQAEEEDRRAFGTSEPDSDASAAASFERAVTLRFLLAFTIFHDCWEWPTWKVVQELVKPATAARRCRYAELPAIAACGAVGPADTFGSHCWGAKCAPPPRPSRRAPAALRGSRPARECSRRARRWGLLVAALTDHADLERRVWIDCFAVRQWPGSARRPRRRRRPPRTRALIFAPRRRQTRPTCASTRWCASARRLSSRARPSRRTWTAASPASAT